MSGTIISEPEVTHVSRHGCWISLGNEELLLSFYQFPWFRKASIEQLSHVQWPSADHLYWPDLDVDLSVASIRSPGDFPLVASG